jgi:ELWxxDGT repeat protein
VKKFYPNNEIQNPGRLTNVDGTLFFTIFNGNSMSELWKSDGTETGTVLVKDFDLLTGYTEPGLSEFTNINGTLFFYVYSNKEPELWKSNGTNSGTILVKTFDSFGACKLTSSDNYFFFCAKPDYSGYHNFAKYNKQHNKNAKAYREFLNKEKIFK